MPDGPYATPDETAVLRMLGESGSPAQAARDLFARLEMLEAWADELEHRALLDVSAPSDAEAVGARPTTATETQA